MITSRDNDKLKLIRKLHTKRERDRSSLFIAEGEDLVDAAGATAEFVLVAGEDVEPDLLNAVSTLGSGTRVIGVFRQAWSQPGGDLSVYLHGVADPGNVGTIIRSAHAFADGPVVLGPGCADPYSPKAVRASMGSIFARPPARARFEDLPGTRVAFEAGAAPGYEAEPPVVLCFGSERAGLDVAADLRAGIPMREGLDSLNVAMAATVALYDRFRMARHG
ncbi:MAG: TrmH family RNA methyltransferase [Thermoleophilaceae bacterium]